MWRESHLNQKHNDYVKEFADPEGVQTVLSLPSPLGHDVEKVLLWIAILAAGQHAPHMIVY